MSPLVGAIVHSQPTLLAAAIESLVLTGPTARAVERHLVGAITPAVVTAPETERLLALLEPTQFAHVRAALQQLAVQHARSALDEDDAEVTRAALAVALNSLGVSLRDLGRHQQALVLQGQMYGRASLTCDDASPVFPVTRHFSSI